MDSDGSCSAPMEESERPDLSLLKPLWSLYTSMLEKEGGNILQAGPEYLTPLALFRTSARAGAQFLAHRRMARFA